MIEIKSYWELHAFERFFLKDVASPVASHFYLNKVQLTRSFHAAFGKNPMDYVTLLRLNKSKSLLTSTEYTIDHIAQQCGYDNGFYFSRVFLKHVGMNLSQYRKTHCV